jgi:hypothetical protein
MQGHRGRKDERVTIGQVLIESRNLPPEPSDGPTGATSASFDSHDGTNYFAHTFEWARHPHKLISRPFPRIFGGSNASGGDVCSTTGLLMHELNDQSIAATTGGAAGVVTSPHPVIHRSISEPVRADGQGAEARPDRSDGGRPIIQPRVFDKIEAFISKLSMRDNFWNGVCSLIWLPLAFFSGVRMKEIDQNSFAARAILPFRRFNRNWYRAMAGGALLANSEIAGGSYVFGICGADYTVVCKNLNYTFLRPCFGPAIYRMQPREDIKARLETKKEFNITIDMDITQQAARRGEKDKRVGRCEATFHITPKVHHQRKKARRRDR